MLVLGAVPGIGAAKSIPVGSLVLAVDDTPVSDEEQLRALVKGLVRTDVSIQFVDDDDALRTEVVEMAPEAPDSARVLDYLNARAQMGDPVARFLTAQSSPRADVGLDRVRKLVGEIPNFAEARALQAKFGIQVLLSRPVGTDPVRAADIAEVEASLARAEQLDPRSASVRLIASETMLALNRPDAAEQQALNALGLDPESPRAHNLLGSARMAMGRPAEALADLHRSVELNPYEPSYYKALSAAYNAVRRPHDAAATERALAGLLSSDESALQAKFVATRKAVAAVLVLGLVVVLADRTLARRRQPEDLQRLDLRSALPKLKRISNYRIPITELLVLTGAVTMAAPYLATGSGFVERYKGGPVLLAHLLPGLVLVVGGVALLRREGSGAAVISAEAATAGAPWALYAALGLAGVWLCGAHLGTFADALENRVPWPAFLWYSSTGPVSLVLVGLLFSTRWDPPEQHRLRGDGAPLAAPSGAS